VNYLAHSALSEGNSALLAGNMAGDYIKGNQWQEYPPALARGMLLHRIIDEYADSHPLLLGLRAPMYPTFGKFAGVATDLLLDRLLATHWQTFYPQPLEQYTQDMYAQMQPFLPLLPKRFVHMFSYMQQQNWLLGYATAERFQRACNGLDKRTRHIGNLHAAPAHLAAHLPQWEQAFFDFYPQVQQVCTHWLLNNSLPANNVT
jgi:acyl carrier protein phosphodiesterase